METNPAPITGAEDFSFMLNARPGRFVFIGSPVHTPGYDFNDDILTRGAAYWVQLVHTEMSGWRRLVAGGQQIIAR